MTTEQTEKDKRFTIGCSKEHQVTLAAVAKKYKITQGEVVEAMLDSMNEEAFAPFAQKIRDGKVVRRAPSKELFNKFKQLTDDQIAALEKMAVSS